MKSNGFRQFLRAVLLCAGFAGAVSCGQTAKNGSYAGSEPLRAPVKSEKTLNSGTTVVPPVPVMGSYLTTVLSDNEGAPLQNANVLVVENQYSSFTDMQGEVKLPVSKIPSRKFLLQIRRVAHQGAREIDGFYEAALPEDLFRMLETEGAKVDPANGVGDLRWGLSVPEASGNGTGMNTIQNPGVLTSVVLPKTPTATPTAMPTAIPTATPTAMPTAMPTPTVTAGSTAGWLQYHTQVQSCFPTYSGPSLLLANGQIDPNKFGQAPPACDATRKGQVFCTSREDGSPSRCFMCETNLYYCP